MLQRVMIHRPAVQAEAADRRRADHGAGRHNPGDDHSNPEKDCKNSKIWLCCISPIIFGIVAEICDPGFCHVRRLHSGAGFNRRYFLQRRASLHAAPAPYGAPDGYAQIRSPRLYRGAAGRPRPPSDGCVFQVRCPSCMDICRNKFPPKISRLPATPHAAGCRRNEPHRNRGYEREGRPRLRLITSKVTKSAISWDTESCSAPSTGSASRYRGETLGLWGIRLRQDDARQNDTSPVRAGQREDHI